VVTVAVISWNTRALLIRCLRALEQDVAAGDADVWVVDNGSTDGSAAAARAQAPWATVVEAPRNLGFGCAVNLVAERTAGDWLVCANADVAVKPGALRALLAAAGEERVGAVAPRLLLADGRTQHSVYPFPTLPFTVAFNLGLPRLSARWSEKLCLEGRWNPDRPRSVPWAIGALLLLRRRAFEEVGGFDPRRWMYAEDLDLGWRLHDGGWVTRYEPAALVQHASGAATELAFGERRVERYMRETYAVILARRGIVRTWTTAAVNVAGAAARLAWAAPLGLVWRRHRAAAARALIWLRAHRQGLRSPAALRGER
jgi:N-acetylglucosaminyl-diphospho-decaprenol L-rhamnosyltransferase